MLPVLLLEKRVAAICCFSVLRVPISGTELRPPAQKADDNIYRFSTVLPIDYRDTVRKNAKECDTCARKLFVVNYRLTSSYEPSGCAESSVF